MKLVTLGPSSAYVLSFCLWHGTSVFLVSSEGLPHSVASYDTRGDMEDLFYQSPFTTHKGMRKTYSNPDPHGPPTTRLLRHTRGCGGPILTRILTGLLDGNHKLGWLLSISYTSCREITKAAFCRYHILHAGKSQRLTSADIIYFTQGNHKGWLLPISYTSRREITKADFCRYHILDAGQY
jgi:hypothetical protein